MSKIVDDKKKILIILLSLVVVFSLIYLRFASYKISEDCIRTIEMSYKDGFISAGLIGTIYRMINMVVPVDMFDYEMVYFAAKCMLVLYYVLAGIFVMLLFVKKKSLFKNNIALVVLFIVYIAGMFGVADTLGSYDMYEMMVLLFIAILLTSRKVEWLIIPSALIGVLIHPSFLFKCMGIVVAVMIYRWKVKKENKYKPFLIILVAVVLIAYIASEISLAINVFENRQLLANKAVVCASSLIPEWNYRGRNYINLIIFLLAYSPYLLIGRDFFKRMYAKGIESKKVYRFMQLGALIILPEFILKVQYGFLIYFVIMYYVLLLLILNVEEDTYIFSTSKEEKKLLKDKLLFPEVLVLYPLLLMPFMSLSIMRGFDVIAGILGA